MEQIILNLVPGGVSPVCYVSQYDVGRKIRLHLRNGSDPYVLSGAETVTATIRKVSGEELIYDIANTSASYVDLIVNYDATDVIGESVCELIITESGLRIGSANFKMRIDPDVYSGDQKLEVVSATSENPDLSFETNVEENLLELKAGFSPVQDLHGYDSPWIDSNIVNKKPYLMRAIAGTASRIGTHEYNKIVGGTVAFNQLNERMRISGSLNGLTFVLDNDGFLTVSGKVTTAFDYNRVILTVANTKFIRDGRKYLILLSKPIDFSTGVNGYSASNPAGSLGYIFTNNNGGVWDNGVSASIPLDSEVNITNLKISIFDLTQMFGSTIADYIYSLDQAIAGAGVAWFKALFPNDYYAYNAGELMSVKTSAHVTKDANDNVISNIALDPDLELRGIPKLDENNNLYYDGDEYASDGGVKRRYGVVDLGSLTWRYIDSSQTFYSTSLEDFYAIRYETHEKFNCLCIKYVNATRNDLYTMDKAIALLWSDVKYVSVKDSSFTDPADLKNALSGVYLVYIKATPTTETADPFTNPQEIDPNGSEEFVDNRSVSIPVGHESYYANICEIEGIDEITFNRTGVNLYDNEYAHYRKPVNYFVRDIKLEQGVTYTLNAVLKGVALSGCYVGVANNGEQYSEFGAMIPCVKIDGTTQTQTFAPTNTWISPKLIIYAANEAQFNEIFENYDIQLEKGTQASEYHAYDGKSVTVDIGQEVYGGYYDNNLGIVLTDKLVDLGSLTWNRTTSYNNPVFYANINDKKLGNNTFIDTLFGFAGNFNNAQAFSVSDNGTLGNGTANEQIYARLDEITDKDTFKSFVTGVKLCYELATPIIIPADKVNLITVNGINNLMHDANGGTEVKFFRMISAS